MDVGPEPLRGLEERLTKLLQGVEQRLAAQISALSREPLPGALQLLQSPKTTLPAEAAGHFAGDLQLQSLEAIKKSDGAAYSGPHSPVEAATPVESSAGDIELPTDSLPPQSSRGRLPRRDSQTRESQQEYSPIESRGSLQPHRAHFSADEREEPVSPPPNTRERSGSIVAKRAQFGSARSSGAGSRHASTRSSAPPVARSIISKVMFAKSEPGFAITESDISPAPNGQEPEEHRMRQEIDHQSAATIVPDEVLRRLTEQVRDGGLLVVEQEYMEPHAKKNSERCTLRPDAKWRILFDLLSLIVVLNDSTIQPFIIAWDPTQWDQSTQSTLRIVSMLSLSFWTVDMILTSLTGYYTEGEGDLEMRLHMIIKQYLRGWFAIDITINGLDWVGVLLEELTLGESNSEMLQWSRVGRLVRTARILRIFRIIQRIRTHSQAVMSPRLSLVIQACQLLAVVVWMNHLLACCWYGCARAGMVFFAQTWLDRVDGGPTAVTFSDAPVDYQYFTALHWSMTQMTPGSMEVFPTNSLERAINVAALIFGLLFGTSLISQLSAKMVQFNMSRQEEHKRMTDLRRFLQESSISSQLARRVQHQILVRLAVRKPLIEGDVQALGLLSRSLRFELQTQIFAPHLERHPLLFVWTQLNASIGRDLCAKGCLEYVSLSHGDDLFSPNTTAEKVFLLLQGRLTYSTTEVAKDMHRVTTMDSDYAAGLGMQMRRVESLLGGRGQPIHVTGCWLCEPAFWMEWSHHGSMECDTTSLLVALKVLKTLELIKKHKILMHVTRTWAKGFASAVESDLLNVKDLDTFTDNGPGVMFMPEEPRFLVNMLHLKKYEANNKWGSGRPKRLKSLYDEIQQGLSAVLFEGKNVVRTVVFVTLDIELPHGLILANIASKAGHHWVPDVDLPGTELRAGETPRQVGQDMLNQIFPEDFSDTSCLQDYVKETAETMSPNMGILYRYHRITYTVNASDATLSQAGEATFQLGGRNVQTFKVVDDHGAETILAIITPIEMGDLQEDTSQIQDWLSSQSPNQSVYRASEGPGVRMSNYSNESFPTNSENNNSFFDGGGNSRSTEGWNPIRGRPTSFGAICTRLGKIRTRPSEGKNQDGGRASRTVLRPSRISRCTVVGSGRTTTHSPTPMTRTNTAEAFAI